MHPAHRLWSRPYSVSARAFQVTTKDDVVIRGHRLGSGSMALVFSHGFGGWHRKPRLVRFQEELGRSLTVFALDFRGHGQSGGRSTFGAAEYLDIEAVVRRAREEGFERVVTWGASMGGIAAIRHGALVGGVDGVVAVSTPARWVGHDTEAVRRLVWLTATPTGRRLLRSLGVRVDSSWEPVENAADLVGALSPIPLLVVHGRDDHFFDEENAWLLYRLAGPPKRLLVADRFGHAEDGFSPSFAGRIARAIEAMARTEARAAGRGASGAGEGA